MILIEYHFFFIDHFRQYSSIASMRSIFRSGLLASGWRLATMKLHTELPKRRNGKVDIVAQFPAWKSNLKNVACQLCNTIHIWQPSQVSHQMSKMPQKNLHNSMHAAREKRTNNNKIHNFRTAQSLHWRWTEKWKIKFESHCAHNAHTVDGIELHCIVASRCRFGRFVHGENKRECKLGTTRIRWLCDRWSPRSVRAKARRSEIKSWCFSI